MKVERSGQSMIHVEVAVNPLCPTPLPELKVKWQNFLAASSALPLFPANGLQPSPTITASSIPEELAKSCLKASVTNNDDDEFNFSVFNPRSDPCNFVVDIFVLNEEEACTEELDPSGDDGDDDFVSAADSLSCPHIRLDGLWESLILHENTKKHLLNYAKSALHFSDRQVSSHIVHWNRVILLHGPPGTGKTSLCRALANKLAIRLGERFPRSTLLEIRSHSLFSKWFSTSGKLVSSLFQMIKDMVQDDPGTLICVLIDEVESLASSRDNTASGDPGDAMRAVNSLLTSLDKLRSFSNVLVMATTNLHITGTIDAAFVDRCDLLLEIEMPPEKARYEILRSCIMELKRVGILRNEGKEESILSYTSIDENYCTALLLECAKISEGLSGRSLRRLPLQAHAKYISETPTSTTTFLQALMVAIQDEQVARSKVARHAK